MTKRKNGAKQKAAWKKRVRLELVKHDIRQTDIARTLGVTPAAVYHVTGGRKRIVRVIEALVAAGMPAEFFEDNRKAG